MSLRTALQAVTMIYSFCYYLVACVRVAWNLLWTLFTIVGAGIPWLLAGATAVWCAGKVLRLRRERPTGRCGGTALARLLAHDDDSIRTKGASMLTTTNGSADGKGLLYWPVAHRGANLDAPENSVAALRLCAAKRCQMVLLDLALTKCGELVILHRSTVAGGRDVATVEMAELRELNIAQNHALHGQYPAEAVLTLPALLRELRDAGPDAPTVFLLLSNSTKPVLNALRSAIETETDATAAFGERIVICSDSMYALYKLRQQCTTAIVCALWTHRQPATDAAAAPFLVRAVAPFAMVAMLRSALYYLLAPAVGVSVVFVPKDEYNACIKKSWYAAGVRPIVYPVNSPNEKLYFQRNLRTHYLTGSLRTEPQQLLGGKRKH